MQREYKGACTCRSRNAEDKRRVVDTAGKNRARHCCVGTNLSTTMADSVQKRVVPAVPIPSVLHCAEEVPTHGEVAGTKPCVIMLFLPLQGCTVEDMAKGKVLPEYTESIVIKMITPVIDEEPL